MSAVIVVDYYYITIRMIPPMMMDMPATSNICTRFSVIETYKDE
tara:strand:- start:78 stop:209 length:132 start_codon:yes stop_codon:yes gene_type:complete